MITDTCSPTLKTDQNLAYLGLFKRRNKPQNVLNIHETLPILLPIRCPLKNIVDASWKVLKYAWEPRNGDSGRLGNLSAIFPENNSSMTSQLSLNFRDISIPDR